MIPSHLLFSSSLGACHEERGIQSEQDVQAQEAIPPEQDDAEMMQDVPQAFIMNADGASDEDRGGESASSDSDDDMNPNLSYEPSNHNRRYFLIYNIGSAGWNVDQCQYAYNYYYLQTHQRPTPIWASW